MTSPPTSYHKWIGTERERDEALSVARNASLPFLVSLKRDKRTGKQNNRQWAMLTKIAKSLPWHGQMLSPEDWKALFMDALYRETRMVPAIENNGFVILNRSTSNLTVQEHSDLTALIEAFAANHGVDVGKPERKPQPAQDADTGVPEERIIERKAG